MVFSVKILRKFGAISALLTMLTGLSAEEPPKGPSISDPNNPDMVELHSMAQSLWDELVPENIKAEYELMGPDEMQALLNEVVTAGQEENLQAYINHAPAARNAMTALQSMPAFADYAGWLRAQLEDMEAAQTSLESSPMPAPEVNTVPMLDVWLGRMAKRPRPERADKFLPILTSAFAAEGIPASLVWLAETESSFNPSARSPVGARGLFQLMPATAKSLGLSLFPLDQRTHPEASARAAAVYLKKLHTRFGDWPLALAAYNAGEGRVGRTMKAENATDFAGIAAHLPAETQLYVPKVLATVQVRTGVTPGQLENVKSASAKP